MDDTSDLMVEFCVNISFTSASDHGKVLTGMCIIFRVEILRARATRAQPPQPTGAIKVRSS
jgi:hypothetical protein